MLPVLLVVALAFLLLLLIRVGGAQRRVLMARWPALLLAAAAIYMAARGGAGVALALGLAAAAAWVLWPAINRSAQNAAPSAAAAAETEARAVLGVGADASEADIRRAYRKKMADAHPDRGGAHAKAARLTAARDLLLRQRG